MGRNDRLGQGWSGEKVEARDRVGRNDRLGRGNEEGRSPVGREVEGKQERAKDRVGRNDRLSPGGGREWIRKWKWSGGQAVKRPVDGGTNGERADERCRWMDKWTNVDGWTNGQKQLFRVSFGWTFATFQDGPRVVSCPFWPLLPLGFLPF